MDDNKTEDTNNKSSKPCAWCGIDTEDPIDTPNGLEGICGGKMCAIGYNNSRGLLPYGEYEKLLADVNEDVNEENK